MSRERECRASSDLSADRPVRVGISACLLGQQVRYDGGHRHEAELTATLARYFQLVPVCPEVELGLGTPRDPMRLEYQESQVRLRVVRTGADLTAQMRRFARCRLLGLASEGLCGFVLKSGSPSCGLRGVPIYAADGHVSGAGRGLFAAILAELMPELPIEDEQHLADRRVLRRWVQTVFGYHRSQLGC